MSIDESTRAIAVVGPMWPYRGGISSHTSELYSAIRRQCGALVYGYSFKRQYPACLYPFETDKDPGYSQGYKHEGADYRIDSINPISWLGFWRDVRKKRVGWLIIPWWHVFFFPLTFATLLFSKAFRIKTLLIVHNVQDHEASFWRGFLSGLVFRTADLLLVQNRTDRANLERKARGKTILMHPQPLFNQYQRIQTSDVETLQGQKGKIRVLSFGFMRPYKGIDVLLDACEVFLSPESTDLLVAGEWADKGGTLHRRARDLHEKGRINLVDRYLSGEEVSRFFEWADVVVLPYVDTTGSAVIATAFHFQTPVIATRNGFFEDWIVDGKSGYLIPMRDPGALAEAVLRVPRLEAPVVKEEISRKAASMTWESLATMIVKEMGA